MNKIVTIFALVASAFARATPGGLSDYAGGHGNAGATRLQITPDLGGYEALHYPSQGLQELGTVYEGDIPGDVVKINNVVALKIHKPYPVEIPIKVPYPVHIQKPFPVVIPQLIKVPHVVPVEVVKNVAVPVEVPKPYPVPVREYKDQHQSNQYSSGNDYIQGSYSKDSPVADSYSNLESQDENTESNESNQQQEEHK